MPTIFANRCQQSEFQPQSFSQGITSDSVVPHYGVVFYPQDSNFSIPFKFRDIILQDITKKQVCILTSTLLINIHKVYFRSKWMMPNNFFNHSPSPISFCFRGRRSNSAVFPPGGTEMILFSSAWLPQENDKCTTSFKRTSHKFFFIRCNTSSSYTKAEARLSLKELKE